MEETIQQNLKKAFPDALIQLSDMTGQGNHFELRIISEAFRGKKLIEQHRLVHEALGELMSGPIHALELHTVQPD